MPGLACGCWLGILGCCGAPPELCASANVPVTSRVAAQRKILPERRVSEMRIAIIGFLHRVPTQRCGRALHSLATMRVVVTGVAFLGPDDCAVTLRRVRKLRDFLIYVLLWIQSRFARLQSIRDSNENTCQGLPSFSNEIGCIGAPVCWAMALSQNRCAC